MKIETYISDLLYRNDCVIVPGLGGFITNYRSAQIHPVSHTLRPPSKSISFNVQLQSNDGLLANYISSCESISFSKAQIKIETFVKSIHNNLAHKKVANLDKVGVLSSDLNGLISFEPDNTLNYLLNSFGLDTVQSPAIIRKSKVVSIPKPFVKSAKSIETQKSSINWKVAAVILPLIGLSTYVSFQQDAVSNAYANYAYLNPFKVKPAAVYTPRYIEMEEKTIVVEAIEMPIAKTTDAPKVETPTKEAEIVEVLETKISEIHFHLVAGCFSSETNAENLVKNLQSDGFESSVIGQNEKGLFRVAFQSFGNKQEALAQMQKLKSSGKSTWLLKQ
jgi:cell division septation protein DedD